MGEYVPVPPDAQRPAYRAVVRDYGAGDVEATVTIVRPLRPKKGTHRAASAAPTPARLAENVKRALARAKTTIRRTVMSANLDHMLTLTYSENL